MSENVPNNFEMPGMNHAEGQIFLDEQVELSSELEWERRIQTALKRLHDQAPVYSIRRASEDYSIPYNTLRNRYNGATKSRVLAFQHLQRLTPAQVL